MASNIVDTTIDETYPVAGVENDSQGFRDNFNIPTNRCVVIKNGIDQIEKAKPYIKG